jgi:hypothetical protein
VELGFINALVEMFEEEEIMEEYRVERISQDLIFILPYLPRWSWASSTPWWRCLRRRRSWRRTPRRGSSRIWRWLRDRSGTEEGFFRVEEKLHMFLVLLIQAMKIWISSCYKNSFFASLSPATNIFCLLYKNLLLNHVLICEELTLRRGSVL